MAQGSAVGKSKFNLPATMWTDITAWKHASLEERKIFLDGFYRKYKKPLLLFVQRLGYSLPDSEDLLHDFIIKQTEHGIFAHANPRRGRFRNLLLSSLKRFVISSHRKRMTSNRHPTEGFITIDNWNLKERLKFESTAETDFQKDWNCTVIQNAFVELEKEYTLKGQQTHFKIFELRFYRPIISETKAPTIADISKEVGIDQAEASNMLVTAKRAFRRILKTEISNYLANDKEKTEELCEIMGFLSHENI